MNFSELSLSEPVLRAVASEGYAEPTPIQAQAIPLVLEGRDLFGCAQTGTGKTAAFALPILHRLDAQRPPKQPHREPAAPATSASAVVWDESETQERPQPVARNAGRRRIRALVLSPTRELAAQIGESFCAYGRNTPLRTTIIFGGVNQNPQVRALRHGVDILVATPGRLLDLMNQGYIDLGGVETFVLDEADRMLDLGFFPDIKRIVAKLPVVRQTLLFSATMPEEIRKLAHSILRDPASVHVAPVSCTADRIDQAVYHVAKRNKARLLRHLLKGDAVGRALVFTRTKRGADRVVKELSRGGLRAAAIHGDKSQSQRERALDGFRTSRLPILVATDIAARGIDVDAVSHVFNYDLPHEAETYVHRIGRTARAGASGIAIAFCDPEERSNLRAIERLIRRAIVVRDDHPEYAEQTNDSLPAQPTEPLADTGDSRPAGRSGQQRGRHSQRRRNGGQSRSFSGGSRQGSGSAGRSSAGRNASGRPAHPHENNGGGSGSRSRGRRRRRRYARQTAGV